MMKVQSNQMSKPQDRFLDLVPISRLDFMLVLLPGESPPMSPPSYKQEVTNLVQLGAHHPVSTYILDYEYYASILPYYE